MKLPAGKQGLAFTRIELLAVLAIVAVLVVLVVPISIKLHQASQMNQCVQNQRQIKLAYWSWPIDEESDHIFTRTNWGGDRELLLEGKLYFHYAAMSNALSDPKLLVCPSDTRQAASSFGALQNSNISYFVGIDATNKGDWSMLLMGDRNLRTDVSQTSPLLVLHPNTAAVWTDEMHRGKGLISLVDGSVMRFTTPKLAGIPAKIPSAWRSGEFDSPAAMTRAGLLCSACAKNLFEFRRFRRHHPHSL